MSFADTVIKIVKKGVKIFKDLEKEYYEMNRKFNQMSDSSLMSYARSGQPREKALAIKILTDRGVITPKAPQE